MSEKYGLELRGVYGLVPPIWEWTSPKEKTPSRGRRTNRDKGYAGVTTGVDQKQGRYSETLPQAIEGGEKKQMDLGMVIRTKKTPREKGSPGRGWRGNRGDGKWQ